MDPLTHTLVGVTLAESGLKHRTRLATATLVIGANLPDIDGVTNLLGRDTALWIRRGWTHGVLAMVLLPAALALAMHVWAPRGGRPRVTSFAWLLALSYLAVLSHAALDWLNNYGIRLLMPFDTTWFYGDAVFIVDPWLWLVLGGPIALSCSRSRAGLVGWTLFGAAGTGLMFGVDAVPAAAQLCWIVGILSLALVRVRRGAAPLPAAAVGVCLAGACLYIGGMVIGTAIAERQVAAWTTRDRVEATAVMAGPVPANPFQRQVIVQTSTHYHLLLLDWFREPMLRVAGPRLDRTPASPVVAAALAAPSVRGLRGWLRFPNYEVESLPEGYRVTIRDMRFARTFGSGLGTAVVELDAALRPR